MEKKLQTTEGETISRIHPTLPSDLLISHIFSKLPIKSIIQCKAVCKAWYNILIHQDFTKTYQEHPPFTSLLFPGFSSTFSNGHVFHLLEVSKDSCITTPIKIPKLRDWSSKAYPLFQRLEGSCNGLVCLSYRQPDFPCIIGDIYMCNPIRGDIIQLPQPSKFLGKRIVNDICAFGYVSSTNQYKVLRVIAYANHPLAYEKKASAEVFTVGIDVGWRPLPPSTLTNFIMHAGIAGDGAVQVFNGILHWLQKPQYNATPMMYTFDLGDEKMGPGISPPPAGGRGELVIKVLSNRLYVVERFDYSKITLWTMKEYGKAESWTKDFVLSGIGTADQPMTILNGGDDILFSYLKTYHGTKDAYTTRDVFSVNIEQNKCTELKALIETKLHLLPATGHSFALEVTYSPCFSSLKEVMVNRLNMPNGDLSNF